MEFTDGLSACPHRNLELKRRKIKNYFLLALPRGSYNETRARVRTGSSKRGPSNSSNVAREL
jgi:hypothetical protein